MARTWREIVLNGTYHVTARINRGEMLFAENQYYKELFLEYVAKAKKKYTFIVQNICIMDNHIHMQIKPTGDSQLCNIMKSILGGFARKYNQINGLKGHVWYDRFKSKVIWSFEQFYRTYLYIANNPVRAKIVESPLAYAFSGFAWLFCKEPGTMHQRVKNLYAEIVDTPDDAIVDIANAYLASFDTEAAQKQDTRIGFFDRKPGRPRKK